MSKAISLLSAWDFMACSRAKIIFTVVQKNSAVILNGNQFNNAGVMMITFICCSRPVSLWD
jgi:hypothetical protein